MKLTKLNLLLILIIILAFVLRFYNLGTIPIGFNDDESAFGFNAYSILKTGKDEWGKLLPFPVFESFGDWKLVGYLYMVVLSQLIFGVNEFATRFPSAAIGVIAVLATYFLSRELFTKKIALLSALLLAVSPWHIVASRNAFESDVLILFITLGTFFFIKGIKSQKYLNLSLAAFVATFYIYRSSWLFTPIFFAALAFIYQRKLNLKELFKKIIIALIFLIPLIPTVLSFQGQSRFFQESFITGVQKVGIINDVNQKKGECEKKVVKIICTINYNKYKSFVLTYFSNYISNLSPETYFIQSTPGGYQGFATRSLFYTFEIFPILIGITFLIKKRNSSAKVLLLWLIIVPIGASMTGVGNPGRLNIFMPAAEIISALGLWQIYSLIKNKIFKKTLILIISAVFIVSISNLITDLFIFYPTVSGSYQRYGYKQLFDYLQNQKGNYDKILVSRKGDDSKQYIHYLFFEKIDPNLFNNSSYTTKYQGKDNWEVVEKIGNIYFYSSIPPLPPKSLLAISHNEEKFLTQPIYQVRYLNGDIAFEVYETDKIIESEKINVKTE